MARQNVYAYPDPDDPAVEQALRKMTITGWFNRGAATEYPEGTRWDGSNHISLATGSQWDHEALYRTAAGRWVRNWWSDWQGSRERWEFIDADAAREWLISNEYSDDDVEAATGEPMPAEMGRPEIGPQLKVRFSQATIDRLDELAQRRGSSRSALIREAVERYLGA